MKVTKEKIKEIIKEEIKTFLNEDLEDYTKAEYKDHEYSKQPIPKVAKELIKLTNIYASNVGSHIKMAGDFLGPGMTVALNKYLYKKLKASKVAQGHKGTQGR